MKKIIYVFAGLMAVLSFASQAETKKTDLPCHSTSQQQMQHNHQDRSEVCVENHDTMENHHQSAKQWKTPVLNIDSRITNH